MPGQFDQYANADRRALSVEPTLGSVLFLIVAATLALYGAYVINSVSLYILFLSGAVSLFCVAIFVMHAYRQKHAPKARAMLVFNSAFNSRSDPAFVTNVSGNIIRQNPACESVLASTQHRDATQFLSRISDNGARLAYTLLNRARDGHHQHETVALADGRTAHIVVFGLEGQFIFWTLDFSAPPQRDQPTAGSLQSCPVIISDDTGAIVDHNAQAVALLKDDPENHDLLRTSVAIGGSNNGQVTTVDGQRFRVFQGIHDGQTKTRETIMFPVATEELTVADPEQFYNTLPVAIARIADDGTVIYANDAAVDLLGARARPGARLGDLMEGLGRSIEDRVRDMCQGRSHMRSEVARAKIRGQEAFLQVTLKRLLLNGDTTLLAVINDATELKTLEAQFVQSQKMHAVGQLAGGVAHDFNNLLTAINGHCDLVLMRHQPLDTDYGDLIQIRHNANRAASLVGQLLAFSRKQTLVPKVVDLYDTLSDLNHLLNRLLGEKVTLRIEAGPGLPNVRVDERQLEQVIMNLVVNARDAMPDGGEVEIKAREITLEDDVKRDNAVIPFGQYVQIDVSDTGVGIPADQIRKIFEPFYTTKKVGEGTGLGLSTAYGIIKQTGGFIFAQSEIGMGTTFTVYLPALAEDAHAVPSPRIEEPKNQDLTGNGVVLLVEDELPVRSFAARALTIRGYTVLEAASAEEALEILEDEDLHVDIFVSDVIMPGMDGPTWVRKAQELRPDAKVVFVSGYAEDAFEGGKIKVPNATFLPKPFSLNELTLKVKEQMSITIH